MKLTFDEILREMEASLKRLEHLVEGVKAADNPDMDSFWLEVRHETERFIELAEML